MFTNLNSEVSLAMASINKEILNSVILLKYYRAHKLFIHIVMPRVIK